MAEKVIRLSKSCIGQAEKEAVMRVLDREYLGMGTEVQLFEQELSSFFGRPAVCVVNGTAALHLALQAAGIGAGDEVLVQSLTYVASFQAISATGAKPVACDVLPESLTIDLADAEKRLTERTRAIMPVHYAGGVGALGDVYAFAERYGLRVIEDAAHAFGSLYEGRRVGGFGDIACFSFDGIKNITSGEGGCVVTDDEAVLQRVRDARLLGVERDTERRYAGERSWDFNVTAQGWRYHMSEIMAAIGIVQLERFSEILEKRRKLATEYIKQLQDALGVTYLEHDYSEVVPHIFPIRIKGLIDRKGLQHALARAGIQTGYHYQPNHWLSLYATQTSRSLPHTEAIFRTLLTLPLHEDLENQDVEYICLKLKATHGDFCQ